MRAAEIRKCIDQTRTNATYTPEVKRHITEALVSELRRAAAEHLGSGGGGATPTSSATAASPVARRRDARDALSAAAATPIDESPSWLWSAARTANGSFAPANSSRVVAASKIFVTLAGGCSGGTVVVSKVVPGTGSFVVTILNRHASTACGSAIEFFFLVVN